MQISNGNCFECVLLTVCKPVLGRVQRIVYACKMLVNTVLCMPSANDYFNNARVLYSLCCSDCIFRWASTLHSQLYIKIKQQNLHKFQFNEISLYRIYYILWTWKQNVFFYTNLIYSSSFLLLIQSVCWYIKRLFMWLSENTSLFLKKIEFIGMKESILTIISYISRTSAVASSQNRRIKFVPSLRDTEVELKLESTANRRVSDRS